MNSEAANFSLSAVAALEMIGVLWCYWSAADAQVALACWDAHPIQPTSQQLATELCLGLSKHPSYWNVLCPLVISTLRCSWITVSCSSALFYKFQCRITSINTRWCTRRKWRRRGNYKITLMRDGQWRRSHGWQWVKSIWSTECFKGFWIQLEKKNNIY